MDLRNSTSDSGLHYPDYLFLLSFLKFNELYLPIGINLVGLFGNIMVMLIMFKKHNRQISTCNYLLAVSFTDFGWTLSLIWMLVLAHLYQVSDTAYIEYHKVFCKIGASFKYWCANCLLYTSPSPRD